MVSILAFHAGYQGSSPCIGMTFASVDFGLVTDNDHAVDVAIEHFEPLFRHFSSTKIISSIRVKMRGQRQLDRGL